jgi:hypothetical protein
MHKAVEIPFKYFFKANFISLPYLLAWIVCSSIFGSGEKEDEK